MPLLVALLAALLLALGGCGDDGSEAESTATAEAPTAAEQAGCEQVQAPEPDPEPAQRAAPKEELDPTKTYVATVLTSCGQFEITLDAQRAPKTGGAFKVLADEGFYDGLTFHRIVAGFVIQGGDPLGSGQGGPGFSVVEAPPEDLVYEKSVVAMAKTAEEAAGTSGSQFFVVTAEDAGLPPEYALLGEVTEGIEVVDRIAAVEVDDQDAPVEPVLIRQIAVEAR
jgi:cyclophilin family peptidyl-prolyl cis-trans isomerase